MVRITERKIFLIVALCYTTNKSQLFSLIVFTKSSQIYYCRILKGIWVLNVNNWNRETHKHVVLWSSRLWYIKPKSFKIAIPVGWRFGKWKTGWKNRIWITILILWYPETLGEAAWGMACWISVLIESTHVHYVVNVVRFMCHWRLLWLWLTPAISTSSTPAGHLDNGGLWRTSTVGLLSTPSDQHHAQSKQNGGNWIHLKI